MPRVTVGLPVYNGARYLRIAIEAILAQTYTDFEFLIVDNASTDETEAISREYAAKDDRIRYHRNEVNIGAPGNFNRTFRLAKGEFLKWTTSDDWVAPTMIEKCLAVLDEHPDGVICFPNAELVDPEGRHIDFYDDVLDLRDPRPSLRFIQLMNTIKLAHQHTGLIRCSALEHTALHGDFIWADINFLAELSLYGKFYLLPEYLLYRRFHPGSSSWDKSRKRQVEWSDPRRGGRIKLDAWVATWWFFDAVRRSPCPFGEKAAMYRYLLKRMYWKKGDLGEDLKFAFRQIDRRLSGGPSRSTQSPG